MGTLTKDQVQTYMQANQNATTFEFDLVSISDTNITHSWNYGDGIVSSVSNTVHQYEYLNCNNYLASLVVEDGNSCKDDSTITVIVRCNPVADFTTESECLGDSVKFINQTNLVTGTSATWQWDFGDNPPQGSSNENPSHLYDSVAVYTINLTVFDDQVITGFNGCSDSYQETVEIYALPEPSFEIQYIACEGDITVFENTSTIINSPPNPTYHWNLNNFNGQWILPFDSNSFEPRYRFNECNDNYPVTLTITDFRGCKDSITNYVEVYCNPIANFTLGDIRCQRDSLYILEDSYSTSGSPIYLWNWNFPPTASPSGPFISDSIGFIHPDTISTMFNNTSGNVLIQLDIQDMNGCSDNIDSVIFIYDQPNVQFSWNNACANEDVEFTNLSTAINCVKNSSR